MSDHWQDQPRHPAGTPEGGQWKKGGVVTGYLRQISSQFGRSLEDFVLRHGRRWQPSEHPYPQGEKKLCYQNAFFLADTNPEYTYVEGFAVSSLIGFPFQHAWVVDAAGNVIDTTWDDGVEYFGIPFNIEFVRAVLFEKGTYGVLDFTSDIMRRAFEDGLPHDAIPEKWRRR